MKRRRMMLCTIVLMLLVAAESSAAGWGVRRRARPQPSRGALPQSAAARLSLPLNSGLSLPLNSGGSSPSAAAYKQLYPRYSGAFHARDVQNLGIPTGDVGLRGNGMGWTPW